MTEGRLRAAIAILALAGAAVAAYLVYARYTGTRLACTTGGCETVQHSKYAKAAGINSTPSFEIGKTGGDLQLLQVGSLDPAAFRPALNSLLGQ